jgi:hypothetical protein
MEDTMKNLILRHVHLLKKFILIYFLTSVLLLTVLNQGAIINRVAAEPYNGPDYYVSATSGSDSNDGSLHHPWKTLEYAMKKPNPGDTVYIMAGVYYDTAITPWSAKSGTASHVITYKPYGNGEVILDGSGSDYLWGGILWLDGKSHIRISGLTLRNGSSHGIYIENTGSNSCSNITIDHCTIYNCTDSGILFLGNGRRIYDITVESNTLHDIENGWHHQPGQEVISMGNCERFEIKNNYLYDYHKIGINSKAGCSDGSIHGNRMNTTRAVWTIPNLGSGPYVDAQDTNCHDISIFNNVVWGNGTGYSIATEQGGTLQNIFIYNNIYNGTGNAFQINDHTSVPGSHLKTNCMYINNVVGEHANVCFKVTDKNSSFKNLTVRNNIFAGDIGFSLPGGLKLDYHHVDHNLYDVSSSAYYGSSSVNGSACFIDPESGNFRLLANSPAIDAGSSLDAPAVDFDGVPRPQGPAADIGAFEYITESHTTPDTTPPQISNIARVTSTLLDTDAAFGWVNVSCTASDNIALSQVVLRIHKPDGSWNNVTMTTRTTGKYYYRTSTAFSTVGNYSYKIWAKDSSNNAVSSSNVKFSMPANWDINLDGNCNILDFVRVSNLYGSTGASGWIREDVDNNGVVNILDMNLISNHYRDIWYD